MISNAGFDDSSLTLGVLAASFFFSSGTFITSNPFSSNRDTIESRSIPLICDPFGIVITLPMVLRATGLEISLNPSSIMISITSGYSVARLCTFFFISNTFSAISISSFKSILSFFIIRRCCGRHIVFNLLFIVYTLYIKCI